MVVVPKFFKRTKIYQNIIRLARLFKSFEVKSYSFIVASLFSFLASVFEGLSLALLIPAVKGLFEGSFSFAEKLPVLGAFLRYVFSIFGQRQAVVFLTLVVLIFMATVFKLLLRYISGLIVVSTSLKITHNLRRKLYARYLSFGKLFFDRTSYGYLHTVLMSFSNQLTNTLMMANDILFFVCSLIAYIAIMITISWQITFFTFLIFPILYFSMSWVIKKIGKSSESLARANVLLNMNISNVLRSIPLVKAYTNEEREKKWFTQASQLVNQHSFSMSKKQDIIAPINEIVVMVMMFMVVGLMSYMLIKKGVGDIAAFMTFFILLRRMTSSARIVNDMQKSMATIKGPLKAIRDVFSDKDKYFIKNGTKIMEGVGKGLELVSIGFSYPGGIHVLRDINISIAKGETVAIVGSTGAGKTTIINLIMRYYDVTSGAIKVNNIDIREYSIESLRSHMALVSQDTHLFNASLEFNLKYGLNGEIQKSIFKEAIKLARIDDFIAKLPNGLKTEIGEQGVKLSGGEKQRVSICRAILKKASIVLLDEATSALDSITERKIQEALDNLTKDATTVVVAHRLSTIKHADNIIVIENGSLVEQGNLKTLLDKKGVFYKYWEEQKFF